jgi:CO/xanthine dehydrogenase Mo-binding subunit
MTILGRRELRIEDAEILTGRSAYVADLVVPGCAYLGYVRSSMAHAEIQVNVEPARRHPGVVAAFTAADLGLPDLPARALPGDRFDVEGLARPLLARDRVRFVGEQVAAIVVEDPQQLEDALEQVEIEYRPLDPVTDVIAAISGSSLLYPDAGSNVIVTVEHGSDGWPGFDGFEVVIRQQLQHHKVLPAPLEVRGCVARWEEDGRVTIWLSTQGPHLARPSFAAVLGISVDQVRMRPVAVGGGFGAKGIPYPDEFLVPLISRLVGRPLKWVETRSESMMMLTPGRGQTATVTAGADRSGRVGAVEYDVIQDAGAYPELGAFMPSVGWLVASGPYAIPHVRLRGRTVVTNATPTGAYRGAGRPEPAYALERLMDLVATEVGLDPAEVRRRNLIRPEQYPYRTSTGTVYDSGDLPAALETLLDLGGYEELKEEQRRRRRDGVSRLGIGLGAFVDIAGRLPFPEFGAVEVTPTGRVVLRTGSSPHGQGHHTVWAMIVAERMGVAISDVKVIHGDTDEVPCGGGTFGSKSLQSAGVALDRAANALVEHARKHAADLLEANPVDLELDLVRGVFHVAGTPTRVASWGEVAQAAIEAGDRLYDAVEFGDSPPTFPSGVYLAAVGVDTETGQARVERLVTCDDAGKIVNPLIAEGQVHGGVAQGIAQVLYEELRLDEAGNPLTSTFADYLIVSAAELPSFDGTFQETMTARNELGVKGIGESGTIGAIPAVVNAVMDALSEFGIRHLDMPLSPERIWRALQDSAPAVPERQAGADLFVASDADLETHPMTEEGIRG